MQHRAMRRIWLAFALLVLSSGMSGVAAQPVPTPVGMNPVGQPLPIYNAEGVESAQITVTEVIDPFEDWAEYYDPQVTERYVVVTLQIENTGERPFEFQPYDFTLLDSVGRLHTGGFPFRSPAAVAAVPDLAEASMLPGETVTGALNFTVPADALLAQVVFMFYAEGQHLYLLADLTGGASALATPGS